VDTVAHRISAEGKDPRHPLYQRKLDRAAARAVKLLGDALFPDAGLAGDKHADRRAATSARSARIRCIATLSPRRRGRLSPPAVGRRTSSSSRATGTIESHHRSATKAVPPCTVCHSTITPLRLSRSTRDSRLRRDRSRSPRASATPLDPDRDPSPGRGRPRPDSRSRRTTWLAAASGANASRRRRTRAPASPWVGRGRDVSSGASSRLIAWPAPDRSNDRGRGFGRHGNRSTKTAALIVEARSRGVDGTDRDRKDRTARRPIGQRGHSSASPDLTRGATVRPVRDLEPIGAGGMGSSTRRTIGARPRRERCKLLHARGDARARARLARRSACRWRSLTHPNVVAVYDVIALGDELAWRWSWWTARLSTTGRERPGGPARRSWWPAPPPGSPGRAHAAGLAHRDLHRATAGRSRRSRAGGRFWPRRRDSRTTHGFAERATTHESPPTAAGTPRYMSPEQRAGLKSAMRAVISTALVTVHAARHRRRARTPGEGDPALPVDYAPSRARPAHRPRRRSRAWTRCSSRSRAATPPRAPGDRGDGAGLGRGGVGSRWRYVRTRPPRARRARTSTST